LVSKKHQSAEFRYPGKEILLKSYCRICEKIKKRKGPFRKDSPIDLTGE